jgi:hypothetical protein
MNILASDMPKVERATLKLIQPPEPVPAVAVYRVGSHTIKVCVWPLDAAPHDPPPGSVVFPGVCVLVIQPADDLGD